MWATPGPRRPAGRPPDLRRRPSTSPLSPSPSPSSSFICLWPSQTGYKPIKVFYHHFHHFNPFHPISFSLVSLSILSMENPMVSLMPWPNHSKTVIWSEIRPKSYYMSLYVLEYWISLMKGFPQISQILKTRMSLIHSHHLIHLSYIPRFQNFSTFSTSTLLLPFYSTSTLQIFVTKPIFL